MNRRDFIQKSLLTTAAGLLCPPLFVNNRSFYKDLIIGHHSHQYKIDLNWGNLDKHKYPVRDCHEMVQDSKGRIILLTNHTKNNVLIYNKNGILINAWGNNLPGAHGLTLSVEDGKDYLFITDTERHEVIKTTIDGKVVMQIPFPQESDQYTSASQYLPTETAIASNGDIYVADGYGLQYIIHYNHKGELQNIFGGKGNGPGNFNNAHGICIDDRKGETTLLITARMQNKLKRFSLKGEYLESIDLPGAFICRPVIKGNYVYLATIWSADGSANTGFISILNEENKLISAPGGSEPIYLDNQLLKMYQTVNVFNHPHDVCIDEDENLYIAQWNSGQTYPIKLYRV
jgi:hypothetical protein